MQSKFINAGSKRNRNIILEEILEERKNKAAKTEEYRNEKLCLMKELIETLKKSTEGENDIQYVFILFYINM